jgi:Pentapeptide repeats (9 copies)
VRPIRPIPPPTQTPYPPDPPAGETAVDDVRALVDVTVADRDWANTSARGLRMLRAELQRCRLTGSELGESTLVDVAFTECRIDLAGLRHARLERVRFRDCNLDEIDLAGAHLVDVRFERCRMRGAVLSVVTATRVELAACDLLGVAGLERLRGASITIDDAIANAPALAHALGLRIVD